MSRLDWNDGAEVQRVLGDLQGAFTDADATVQDMLRPLRERELGPVLHRELYEEARGKVVSLLAYAGAPGASSPAAGGAR